jgi:hypothetical protein
VRMNADGSNVTTINYGIYSPTGIALENNGNIVVADYNGSQVVRMNTNGTIMNYYSPYDDYYIYNPKGIAVDSNGKILFYDFIFGEIKRMNPDGTNIVSLSNFTVERFTLKNDGKIFFVHPSFVGKMNADGSNVNYIAYTNFGSTPRIKIENDGKILICDGTNTLTRITDVFSSNRVAVTINVEATPTAPSASAQTFCEGSTVAELVPTPSSTIKWYSAATGGTALLSTAALSTGTYYVDSTNSNGCTGTRTSVSVTINTPNLAAVANANTTQTLPVVSVTYFSNNCTNNLITKLSPNGASPVSGSTDAKVWIESTQPAQFVKRHYEITPATNASTATGNVTLYFTQAEFDDFNAVNTVKLPTGSADASGIANLLIEKFPGVSSDGTGLPNTYTGSIATINPADANIVWNATQSRWEVSFDVTGFSGFFVKTVSGTLPLHWLNVSGTLNSNKQAVVNFKVNETNIANYAIEKKTDNTNWTTVGTVVSKGNGVNNYQFTDAATIQGITYYRIKQVGINGAFTYSSIIKLSNSQMNSLNIYPNPVKDVVTISGAKVGSKLLLTDISGKLLQQITVTQASFIVDMSKYNSGVYILKSEEGVTQKIIKE